MTGCPHNRALSARHPAGVECAVQSVLQFLGIQYKFSATAHSVIHVLAVFDINISLFCDLLV